MNRLKILHIIIGTEFGGATVMVRLLSQHQIKQGHSVWVLANNVPGAREEFIKHNIQLIDDKGIKGYISPFSDFFHLFYWIYLIRKYAFDIVHTQTVKAGFMGRLAAKIAGTKQIIHSCHGYRLEGKFRFRIIEKLYLFIERCLSRITSVVVVQSHADYQTAIKHKITPEKKIRIVYNGIDISAYEEQNRLRDRTLFRNEIGTDDETVVVGTVGRLTEAKAHKYLIDAAARILRKGKMKLKFAFIGDGPEKKSLKSQIEEHGLTDYFIFLNHRSDIPGIMQGIDMHVLPSIREGFPIVLLEAMASGKPCITTDVGGSAEAVKDGVTGFVVPPKDSESLAKAIEVLAHDRTLIEDMGKESAKRIRKEFTAEIMGNRISDIYNSCVTKNQGHHG